MPVSIHTFSYPVGRHGQTRLPRFYHTRDELACREVELALLETGEYVAGEPIFNQPPEKPLLEQEDLHRESVHRLDLPFIEPGDLILQTIRVPLDDLLEQPRKTIEPGNTDLEAKLFPLHRPYLRKCARNHVRLSAAVCRALRPQYAGHREVFFYMGDGARHRQLNDGRGRRVPREGARHTSLFILYEPEIEPGGPAYLNAFGIDALTTLIWAYRLHRDCSPYLRVPGFSLFQMEVGEMPKRPTDLRWSLDWKIEPVVHYRAQ